LKIAASCGRFASHKGMQVHFQKYLSACIFILAAVSCATAKYEQYEPLYSNLAGNGAAPDYSSLDYWAAHPWKNDPSDSVPRPLRNEWRDSVVDVFFLHPTTHTSSKLKEQWNAPIGDAYLNAKTDYSTILYQASIFNKEARVFAPRYRQAHINVYFTKDTARALAALDLAYSDIKTSFEYYLAHYNNGRPIIIAAHSQGTTHALRLLKEFFDNKPLRNKLVVAYVVGMPIPKNYFSTLTMCKDSVQTGCLCGWRTFKNGYESGYAKTESYVTNPLSWTTTAENIPRSNNTGAVLQKFNKPKARVANAQINNNVLWTGRPRFFGSFLLRTKNYHVGDYNLFYYNVRRNVSTRIGAFWKQ
jgi:Protein of unknown function (DUF3089)